MYKITPAAYIFTHQYLNTMQQGIQSAHVIAELCSLDGTPGKLAKIWAKEYKVIRILNAGSGEKFKSTYEKYNYIVGMYKQNNIPFAEFREPDIDNLMTAFGFIITPEIVARIEIDYRDMASFGIDPSDMPIIDLLQNLSPAK